MVDIRAGLRAGVMLILLFGAGTVRAWPLPPPASPPLSAPKIVTLSEWNGEIDPARMQTADVSAAIVRASYGTERDSRVLENVATLRAAGIPVAALYHEFDPAADWPAQLDTFTEIMRQAGVKRGALRLVGGAPAADARRFMDGLADTLPLPANYRHLVFTDGAAWQAMGQPTWGRRYELWIADDGSAVDPVVPAPWKTWRLWQYTVAGDGPANGVSSLHVGVSRFNGSSAQFESWLKLIKVRGGGR